MSCGAVAGNVAHSRHLAGRTGSGWRGVQDVPKFCGGLRKSRRGIPFSLPVMVWEAALLLENLHQALGHAPRKVRSSI